ncbi:Copine-8, partial [Mortierella sp. AD011]
VGARDRREDTEEQRAARIERISGAVRTILECIGEDPNREGLLKTPERYAKALMFFSKGYEESVTHLMNKALFQEDHDEMVIVKNIDVFSLCEHHMVPFTGKIHIGYIPKNGKVVGLSKIARLAEMFSRRLQVQERLTKQVAMAIQELLDPLGVAVVMEARGLQNKDVMSKSDPQVLLYLYDNHTRAWSTKPYAMTERIKDSLNPVFVNGLQIDYQFETIQKLRFVVCDIDDKDSKSLADQDFLGEAFTDLGSIIGAVGNQVALPLTCPKHKSSQSKQNRGHILIRGEELGSSKRVVNFAMRGIDLTKKGLFKSRPSAFIVIERADENGTFSPVYKSDYVESEDDPIWKPFTVKESVLCNGDPSRPLKVQVMSHKDSGAHTVIGTTPTFSIAGLSHLQIPHSMPIPPMSGTSSLVIQGFSITEAPSFLDFIAGGGTLGLSIAIDFTQSNGDPRNPQSLHYKSPTGENEYTRAIRSVGNILQCYDTNKRFPVYGFGGRINGQVSHAFALNGNPSHPEVEGVEGVLSAYWNAHSFVELYGPTNFATVISEATNRAKSCEPYEYTTLLILTDGAITDMDATVKALRIAGEHALSIIIVGVGNANFTNMNELDGDGGTRNKGRDIVQFVAARNFPPHKEYGLAEALLAELPGQFMDYMTRHQIRPRPPIRNDTEAAMAALYHTAPAATPQYAPPGGPPPAAHPPQSQSYGTQPPSSGMYPGSAPNPGYPYNPSGNPYGAPPPAPGHQPYYPSQYGAPPSQASQYPPPQGVSPMYPPQPGFSHLAPAPAGYPPQHPPFEPRHEYPAHNGPPVYPFPQPDRTPSPAYPSHQPDRSISPVHPPPQQPRGLDTQNAEAVSKDQNN